MHSMYVLKLHLVCALEGPDYVGAFMATCVFVTLVIIHCNHILKV